MGSLFTGSPQTATSYAKSTSETPTWMQDAIYNQVQWAQNIANKPYTSFGTLTPEQQQGYLDQGYSLPRVAQLDPLQQQAYSNVVKNQGFYQGDVDKAQADMYGLSGKGTAADLTTAQNQYLQNPTTINSQLTGGQGYFNTAGQTTANALADKALTAANPYLQAASKTAASQVGSYMSPYQTGVMDVLAKQGARNLSENILPGVSDAFIKAGQFGSSRMGEFGSRAVRDTQEAVLNQQAQLANQGYGQAMSAAQQDLARQGQLAGTVGSISGADLSRILQGAGQYTNLGQAQLAGAQTQQQFGLTAAQQAQAAQAADYQRQMSGLSQFANMQQQEQAMRTADVAALEAAGAAQQAQKQRELDMAKTQWDEANAAFNAEQLYPRQQMDWLSTQVRGLAPITPQTTTQSGGSTGATYSASPLSQLAAATYTAKGLNSLGG